jgi:hypothetical protein
MLFLCLLAAPPAAGAAGVEPPPTSRPQDAATLARALAISEEEAAQRLQLLDRAAVFALRVRSDPDYAGLYLEHDPAPRIVVLFRGDADTALKRHVADSAFIARSVRYSRGDLEDAARAAPHRLRAAGLEAAAIVPDIAENRVIVRVRDLDSAKAAIAAGKLQFPEAARLEAVAGELAETAQTGGSIMQFPQVRLPAAEAGMALVDGMLFERDGCLRIGDPAAVSRLVVWPSSARLAADGRSVSDGVRGSRLVVGKAAVLGGQATELPPPGDLLTAPVTGQCLGPYWVATTGW